MTITPISAADAPKVTRRSKYSPLINALAGGQCVSIPADEAPLAGVRNAVSRAYPKQFTVVEDSGTIFVVAKNPPAETAAPVSTDEVGESAPVAEAGSEREFVNPDDIGISGM